MKKRTQKNCNPKIWFVILTIAIISIVATFAVNFLISSNTTKINCEIPKNVEADLIKTATKKVDISSKIKHVNVITNEESFNIGNHTYPYFPNVLVKTIGNEIPVLKDKIPKTLKTDFETSKILVQKFVAQYFSDEISKKILNEMEKIQFVIGNFTISSTVANSAFIYENQKIYINPLIIEQLEHLPNELIIFTLVHEWIHMVREVTNTSDILYTGRLSEAFTDVIAKAIYNYNRKDINSYSESYYYVYALIAKHQETAIESYFFGFDKTQNIIGKDNLLALAFITEVMQNTMQADGLSDIAAYIALSGISEKEIRLDVLKLL